jgi:hypothetical protein
LCRFYYTFKDFALYSKALKNSLSGIAGNRT